MPKKPVSETVTQPAEPGEVSTKRGPVEVIVRRAGETKKLEVEMQGAREPKYIFTGEWTGKDVNVLLRTLRRAYILGNVELRRAHAINQPQLEVTSNA